MRQKTSRGIFGIKAAECFWAGTAQGEVQRGELGAALLLGSGGAAQAARGTQTQFPTATARPASQEP